MLRRLLGILMVGSCAAAASACAEPIECPRGWVEAEHPESDGFARVHCDPPADYVTELSDRPGTWIYGYMAESVCHSDGDSECHPTQGGLLRNTTGYIFSDDGAPGYEVKSDAEGRFEVEVEGGGSYGGGGDYSEPESIEVREGSAGFLIIAEWVYDP